MSLFLAPFEYIPSLIIYKTIYFVKINLCELMQIYIAEKKLEKELSESHSLFKVQNWKLQYH